MLSITPNFDRDPPPPVIVLPVPASGLGGPATPPPLIALGPTGGVGPSALTERQQAVIAESLRYLRLPAEIAAAVISEGAVLPSSDTLTAVFILC